MEEAVFLLPLGDAMRPLSNSSYAGGKNNALEAGMCRHHWHLEEPEVKAESIARNWLA